MGCIQAVASEQREAQSRDMPGNTGRWQSSSVLRPEGLQKLMQVSVMETLQASER